MSRYDRNTSDNGHMSSCGCDACQESRKNRFNIYIENKVEVSTARGAVELRYSDEYARRMEIMQLLKGLTATQATNFPLEDLVEVSMFARGYKAEYEELGIEVPEWIQSGLRIVKREIDAKVHDGLEKELKGLRKQQEDMAEPKEKKQKIDDRISEILGKLNTKQ